MTHWYRNIVNLMENANPFFPTVTPELIEYVKDQFEEGTHYGDAYSDMQDEAADEGIDIEERLEEEINDALQSLSNHFVIEGNSIILYRAELRPRDRVEYPSVGIFWTWNKASAIAHYGHESAPEMYPNEELVSVIYKAKATHENINWVGTICANIALPSEEEVTVEETSLLVLQALVGEEIIDINTTYEPENISM